MLIVGLCGACVVGACYTPEFQGLGCESNEECGALECVDGACVEVERPASGRCCAELDILFVIDQSLSMEEQCVEESLVLALVGAYQEIFAAIAGNVDSFHIGLTTASILPENPAECRDMGALLRGKLGDECYETKVHGTPYLDERQENAAQLSEAIFCLAKAGTVGDGPVEQANARPVEAMLAALDPARSAPGGCNEGFVRPGAPLLTFMFTNSDQANFLPKEDGSNPYLWWEQLLALRGLDFGEGQKRLGMMMVAGPDQLPPPEVCEAARPEALSAFHVNFSEDLRRRHDICQVRPPKLGTKACQAADAEKVAALRQFIVQGFEEMICELCEP
jgi:hypothetical protein